MRSFWNKSSFPLLTIMAFLLPMVTFVALISIFGSGYLNFEEYVGEPWGEVCTTVFLILLFGSGGLLARKVGYWEVDIYDN